jgi:hypothetical protein
MSVFIIRNLANININTDENIFSVYTEGIVVGKEGIKKPEKSMTCNIYRQLYRWN